MLLKKRIRPKMLTNKAKLSHQIIALLLIIGILPCLIIISITKSEIRKLSYQTQDAIDTIASTVNAIHEKK